MRREMIKDSLSPIAPTVNMLEHLQKEMARVLKDLTTVVHPTGKKRPDLPHQKEFLRVLKKINPKMRYIRNKTLEYDTSPTRVPQQAGHGFRKKRKPFILKWYTRL